VPRCGCASQYFLSRSYYTKSGGHISLPISRSKLSGLRYVAMKYFAGSELEPHGSSLKSGQFLLSRKSKEAALAERVLLCTHPRMCTVLLLQLFLSTFACSFILSTVHRLRGGASTKQSSSPSETDYHLSYNTDAVYEL
jgi:hypothetical protein